MASSHIPHVSGIIETCFHVADVERSGRFYERLFGFPRIAGDGRFCAFEVARAHRVEGDADETRDVWRSVLLLFRCGGTLDPVAISGGVIPPHDGSGRLHFAFAIPTQDLVAWEERLKDSGIAIESRVHWEGGGDSLYFRDPDDHLVELATPGIWPNY